jgi:hypothetical protein
LASVWSVERFDWTGSRQRPTGRGAQDRARTRRTWRAVDLVSDKVARAYAALLDEVEAS